MRVVPNLYPAIERQEVVVHTPRHVTSIAELDPAEVGAVAGAWSDRAGAARDEGFAYVHAFVNEGREAGSSLPHSHSQLAWLREPPPAVAAETRRADDGCATCEWIAAELADGTRVLREAEGLALLTAYAGRLPYEMLVASAGHPAGSAFDSAQLPTALELLVDAARRLRAVEGPVPLNAWLHDGDHWHLEIVPRISVLAGLELGAEIYVNTLAPEEAAERLREG